MQDFWQGHKDSNSGHAVLETAALPTELYPYICYARYYITVLHFCQYLFINNSVIVKSVFKSRGWGIAF